MNMIVDLEFAKNRSNEIVYNEWEKIKKNISELPENPPKIIWKKMGFRSAGMARGFYQSGEMLIFMNINFLYSKDALSFIENTTRHELAHCVTFATRIEMKHDNYWRTVCKFIGGNGNRCHSYEAPLNKPKRALYEYTCSCRHHFLSKRDHNKFMKGIKFSCNYCGSYIEFEKECI